MKFAIKYPPNSDWCFRNKLRGELPVSTPRLPSDYRPTTPEERSKTCHEVVKGCAIDCQHYEFLSGSRVTKWQLKTLRYTFTYLRKVCALIHKGLKKTFQTWRLDDQLSCFVGIKIERIIKYLVFSNEIDLITF